MLCGEEKKNIAKLLKHFDLSYLQPCSEARSYQRSERDFFVPLKDTDNVKKRNIFYKVNYSPEELEAIEATRERMSQKNMCHELTDQILLKHIYATDFKLEKTVERLKLILEYHNHPVITKFDSQTIRSLELGKIYTYGHDREYFPVAVMRVDRYDLELDFDEHFNTMYYLFMVVLGLRMVPYHAEKNVLIIDLNHLGFSKIPFKILYSVIEKLQLYYCGNMARIIIYNWEALSLLWSMVSRFLTENQKKKIMFIQKGKESKILEYIDEYQLEERYGGKLADLTQYWPPQTPQDSFDTKLTKSTSQKDIRHDTQYESVVNDHEFFGLEEDFQVSNKVCGNPPQCSCDIY